MKKYLRIIFSLAILAQFEWKTLQHIYIIPEADETSVSCKKKKDYIIINEIFVTLNFIT
jgi:hypothetical protein